MKTIPVQTCRVILLGALLVMADLPAADGSPGGPSGYLGRGRHLVLQVRGRS